MRRAALHRPLAVFALASAALAAAACGWDPSRPFDREAPEVNRAIREIDGGDAAAANAILGEYLATGECTEGKLGGLGRTVQRPFAGLDLGLALFKIGEAYGRPFGEEEGDGGLDDATRQLRDAEIECALAIAQAVAADETAPLELRARARYLEGNLLFLGRKYKDAVKAYDKALALVPGVFDGGDHVGRDAAHNRAIALRRLEDDEKRDAGRDSPPDAPPDSPPDAAPDAPPDAAPDSGKDAGPDGGDGGGKDGGDGGSDGGGGKDGGGDKDGGASQDPPPPTPKEPPKRNASQDERMLDQLENAPTVQQEAAKKRAQKRQVRGVEDK